MTKVLATFGDSWPAGAELGPNDLRYGEILQQKLGFDKFFNFGQGGNSNEHMIIQLQEYFEQYHQLDYCVTAVFFLTNPNRTIYFPKYGGFNIYGNERSSWNKEAKEAYLKNWVHFYSDDITVFRNSIAITTLQQWCKIANIKDYYFSGWVKYHHWLPTVNTDKIWKKGKETAGDWFSATKHNSEHLLEINDNPYFRPNFAHPNQLGHQLIADRLAEWIESTR
jgi:hypothetical protein